LGQYDQLVNGTSSKLRMCYMELEHDTLLGSLLRKYLLMAEDEASDNRSSGDLFNTAPVVQTCSAAVSMIAQTEVSPSNDQRSRGS
jgi:hypothetical protein